MHRYEKLEKFYYKKRYTGFFCIFVGIFVLLTSIIVLYKTFSSPEKEQKKEIKTYKVEKQVKEENIEEFGSMPKVPTIVEKKHLQKKESETKLILYPVFPDSSDLTLTKKRVEPVQKKEIISKPVQKKEVVVPKKQIIEKVKEKENNKKITIVIKSSPNTLGDLIALYNNAEEYNLAIKIAKLYLEDKKYNKTIEWVKKANKLNSEDYESWYIFAESLWKQKRVKEAKQVLKAYLENYDNSNKKIKQLLRSIK